MKIALRLPQACRAAPLQRTYARTAPPPHRARTVASPRQPPPAHRHRATLRPRRHPTHPNINPLIPPVRPRRPHQHPRNRNRLHPPANQHRRPESCERIRNRSPGTARRRHRSSQLAARDCWPSSRHRRRYTASITLRSASHYAARAVPIGSGCVGLKTVPVASRSTVSSANSHTHALPDIKLAANRDGFWGR